MSKQEVINWFRDLLFQDFVLRAIFSLLLPSIAFYFLYAIGMEGILKKNPRRKLLVGGIIIMTFMGFGVLIPVLRHLDRQTQLVDNELAAIRMQASILSNGGIIAGVFYAVQLKAQIITAPNADMGTASGQPYGSFNSKIVSGSDMVFVIRVSNTGKPTTIWEWQASIITPDGRELPAIIPSVDITGTNTLGVLATTRGPFQLSKNQNLIEQLAFNPLATGASVNGWIMVHVNGLDTIPNGTHYIIKFQDVYERQVKIDHEWSVPPQS